MKKKDLALSCRCDEKADVSPTAFVRSTADHKFPMTEDCRRKRCAARRGPDNREGKADVIGAGRPRKRVCIYRKRTKVGGSGEGKSYRWLRIKKEKGGRPIAPNIKKRAETIDNIPGE